MIKIIYSGSEIELRQLTEDEQLTIAEDFAAYTCVHRDTEHITNVYLMIDVILSKLGAKLDTSEEQNSLVVRRYPSLFEILAAELDTKNEDLFKGTNEN